MHTPRQQATSHKELAARAARSDLGVNTHTPDFTAPGQLLPAQACPSKQHCSGRRCAALAWRVSQ